MSSARRLGAIGLVCLAAAALAATGSAVSGRAAAPSPKVPAHTVVIRWTAHHIPHIEADDLYGIGYGEAYAQATDNVCALADLFLTSSAQRSAFLGPDGTYSDGGSPRVNLASDFFYQRIKDEHTVENLLANREPVGPSQGARDLVRGFAAGYDRFLADTGVNRVSDPTCRGAAWVRPITALDEWRSLYAITLFGGSRALLPQIVAAQPPGAATTAPPATSAAPARSSTAGRGPAAAAVRIPGPDPAVGSNVIAVGGQGTRNHRGLVLANPHFSWNAPQRFYQSQITIPGRLDAAGASMLGGPMIEFGHTQGLAWSHTVNESIVQAAGTMRAESYHFAVYQLTLLPGALTSYRYAGTRRAMTPERVTVLARGADGRLQPRSHTFWRTQYGPVIDLAPPHVAWSQHYAYAIDDVNAGNLRLVDQFLSIDHAQSVPALRQALNRWQGLAFLNTGAADRSGRAIYVNSSALPHITDRQIRSCVAPGLGSAVLAQTRLPLLDGSRPDCALGTDRDAVQRGVFGPSHLQVLERRDYVRNSNDAPWLANPARPLTGGPFVTNAPGQDVGLRAQLSIKLIQGRLAGDDGYGRPGFTVGLMQRLTLGERNLSAERARDAVVAMCRHRRTLTASDGTLIDVADACDALANWNLRADLPARGEALWKEFWLGVAELTSPIWRQPFDPADPIDTPAGFLATNPDVERTLADAVQYFHGHDIPTDVPYRRVQGVTLGGQHIPLPGCQHTEGCFNVIGSFRDGYRHIDSYAQVNFGGTTIQITGWDGNGQPISRTILTYSQSADPTSPYAADQTWMFSDKQWVTPPWTPSEIARAARGHVTTLTY